MIKVVCINDCYDDIISDNWYKMKKGDIILTDEYHMDNIPIFHLHKKNHLGFYPKNCFLKLEEWREQIINKILEND